MTPFFPNSSAPFLRKECSLLFPKNMVSYDPKENVMLSWFSEKEWKHTGEEQVSKNTWSSVNLYPLKKGKQYERPVDNFRPCFIQKERASFSYKEELLKFLYP